MLSTRLVLATTGVLLVVGACAGEVEQATPPAATPSEETSMRLMSTAFEHEGDIPTRFTCDGDDLSPALTILDIPPDAVSLALVMDDPDAPRGTWDHWVAYDIAPLEQVPENVASLGTPGTNSWGRTGYGGPCPPSGTHRYIFTVYALDARLGLEPGADKAAVLDALADHVLAEAILMGRYSRS
jgi:Raf kinase inhibitor-like YbhB/YbcL family protein